MDSFFLSGDIDESIDNVEWHLPPSFWTYLNPQYILCIFWFVCTLPLCFLDVKQLWMSLAVRMVFIPVCFVARPLFLSCPFAEPKGCQFTGWFVLYWLCRLLVLFFPIAVYALGYVETGSFITILHGLNDENECTNDAYIQEIEQNWLGNQPALEWRGTSQSTTHLMLLEYLQWTYFMLYINISFIPIVLWYTRREARSVPLSAAGAPIEEYDVISSSTDVTDMSRNSTDNSWLSTGLMLNDGGVSSLIDDDHRALDIALTTLLVSSFSCWTFYMFYPVAGPLWCPKGEYPDANTMGWMFARLNLSLQKLGAAHGTATPSSHCSASIAMWIVAAIYNRRLAAVMTLWIPALVISTVYCQYHYAVDAISGVIIGLVIVPISLFVDRALRGCCCLNRGPLSAWQDIGGKWDNKGPGLSDSGCSFEQFGQYQGHNCCVGDLENMQHS